VELLVVGKTFVSIHGVAVLVGVVVLSGVLPVPDVGLLAADVVPPAIHGGLIVLDVAVLIVPYVDLLAVIALIWDCSRSRVGFPGIRPKGTD
jgi:hypothetical protein